MKRIHNKPFKSLQILYITQMGAGVISTTPRNKFEKHPSKLQNIATTCSLGFSFLVVVVHPSHFAYAKTPDETCSHTGCVAGGCAASNSQKWRHIFCVERISWRCALAADFRNDVGTKYSF